MAIYDTMQYIKPDVSTICVGQAASMGALLLASGAAGKRYSLPHSRVMIHQPLGGFQGQASDIEIHAREILFLKQRLNQRQKIFVRKGRGIKRRDLCRVSGVCLAQGEGGHGFLPENAMHLTRTRPALRQVVGMVRNAGFLLLSCK